MPFEFINNNSLISNATRKRIRIHAASGRNKGKKVLGRSQRDALITPISAFRRGSATERALETRKEIHNIEQPIDDGLHFPGLLPGESKGLVKKVISFMRAIRFSPELSRGLDYAGLRTPLCVQYMFWDEACFHSTMATAITCLNGMVSEPEGVLQAMHHRSRTYRLVNQKLSSQNALTDLTIAAIVSMAQYEHHQNQYQQGLIHVQGLRRIAQLQGGVLQFLENNSSGLVQKVLRADLECSLHLGSSTLFTIDEAAIGCETTTRFPSLNMQGSESYCTIFEHQFKILSADFRDLAADILFLASQLNDAIVGMAPKLDALGFQNNTLLLGYRLMKLKPPGLPFEVCPLESLVHLGLTAFLATFFQGWDRQIIQNDRLTSLLLSKVHQQPLMADQDRQEVLVWLLFIGAASSNLWKHPIWVLRTKHTLSGLRVKSWVGVRNILAKFPWVNVVHDTAGQILWHSSNQALPSITIAQT